jgi:DNA-binding transcriptional MerR regulator
MHPFIYDDRLMRSQMEERLKRAERARFVAEARLTRKTHSRKAARENEGLRREVRPEASWRLALATPALRDQGMPPEEIHTILEADDPEVIRRHLELHRERLEERFASQRRTVNQLMQAFTAGKADRRPTARRRRKDKRLVLLTASEGDR